MYSLHNFFWLDDALKMRLSSVHARRTSQILKPEAIKFSPCIGLLATSAPNFLANLRSLKLGAPACELAKELFHQRTSTHEDIGAESSRRYGPVAITKSRSRASYWLTPRIMGTMVGLAHSSSMDPVSTRSIYVLKVYNLPHIVPHTFSVHFLIVKSTKP